MTGNKYRIINGKLTKVQDDEWGGNTPGGLTHSHLWHQEETEGAGGQTITCEVCLTPTQEHKIRLVLRNMKYSHICDTCAGGHDDLGYPRGQQDDDEY